MWKQLSLRARIYILLAALICTTLLGGLVTLWHTRAMDSLLVSLIDKDVASFQAAEELEASLLHQKGFLTYFFLDGNPDWLRQMEQHQKEFSRWLQKARKSAYTEAMGGVLGQIDTDYQAYVKDRQKVIELYQQGKREVGEKLHWEVRRRFVELLNLCDRYKLMHEYAIARVRIESQARARFINAFALTALPVVAVIAALLAYILIKQILTPIRRLALETGPGEREAAGDEVKTLSHRVHSLIEDVDQAQSELERSQEHLLQSGKWAMVGKLAAGVAHSIRNPLTSVNMRIYSLKRSLAMSPSQKEDFEVISEEIRHLDAIVRNFLEFSRPPKLKMQRISPSDVVDGAIQLLRYRLESYGVEVKLLRDHRLPEIQADPDQLKEVLANLLVNAYEVMVNGGVITIQEEEKPASGLGGRAVAIRVSDTGPGISEAVRDKIFQPFFSTKEEGTGLGLSIATRIIEDHGGRLRLESSEAGGATFVITLPLKEE